MKTPKKISIATTRLSIKELKEMSIDFNADYVKSGTSGTSGSSGSSGSSGTLCLTRIQACLGKKYGDGCVWHTTEGCHPQTGKCFYEKLNINKGRLYCAKGDYKSE